MMEKKKKKKKKELMDTEENKQNMDETTVSCCANDTKHIRIHSMIPFLLHSGKGKTSLPREEADQPPPLSQEGVAWDGV